MPKYFLDIPVTYVSGHQTFSVNARSLKEAKRKFLASVSMTFESQEVEVEGLEDIEERNLENIYQE